MSEYIMDPGARLVIGPHGRPEESLGACCAKCASGVGDVPSKNVGGATFAQLAPSPASSSSSSSGFPIVALGLGALAIGGVIMFLRRRRRR